MLQRINELTKPVFLKMRKGFQVVTDEWAFLDSLDNVERISKREINWPVSFGPGGGIAATSDGGSVANATSSTPVEATDTYGTFTGRFEIGLEAAESDTLSSEQESRIMKQITWQVQDKMRSFKKVLSIYTYGYSNGVLFEVGSTSSAPTYGAQNRYGESGLAPDVEFLSAGPQGQADTVAFINPAGPTVRGRAEVRSIDPANNEFTLASSIGGASQGDYVVFANHADGTTTDFDKGLNGLLELTKSDTVHNISQSSDEYRWRPAVDESLNGALNGTDLYDAFQRAQKRSGFQPDFGWTTIAAIAAAGGQELDQRRYDREDNTMQLGFEKLSAMGVQLDGMLYCPPGHFFGGSSNALNKITPKGGANRPVPTGGATFDGEGSFNYYGDKLGFYRDEILQAQLGVKSRQALIHYDGVTEA